MTDTCISQYATALPEAQKVVCKQQSCETKVGVCLDQLIAQVQKARNTLASSSNPNDVKALTELQTRTTTIFKEATSAIKELHGAVNRLGKSVDTCCNNSIDVTKVIRDVDLNKRILHKVMVEHCFRQGRFEVGRNLLREAGLEDLGHELEAPFTAMHTVLEQILQHNLEPALQWCTAQLHLHQIGAFCSSSNGNASKRVKTSHQVSGSGPAAMDTDTKEAADKALAQRRDDNIVKSIQAFQFRLQSLGFLTALTHKGQAAALEYARKHFGTFSSTHIKEVQQLMGCLVFCRPSSRHPDYEPPERMDHGESSKDSMQVDSQRSGISNGNDKKPLVDSGKAATDLSMDVDMTSSDHAGVRSDHRDSKAAGAWDGILTLEGSPYEHLTSPNAWESCAQAFRRLACSLMGMAAESPLATVLAAGAAALPKLYKLQSLMATPSVAAELAKSDQLPVELDLGTEFVFHPIFACPVSRDQSTPDNPPMLLPCNHVLCKQSVLKIAKNRTGVFKCPYCPIEARADNLRPLTFPEPLM